MTSTPFDSESKVPSITFTDKDEATGIMSPKPVGTRLGGKIKKLPEAVQQTKFGSSDKLFWGNDSKKTTDELSASGQPNNACMTIVTVLETPEGDRSLWAPKSSKDGSMCKEISKALGGNNPVVGGELWVTLTGIIPNPQGGQPSKQYSASYSAPSAFETPAAVPAPPAPAAVPAPPVPAAAVTTPEGFTLASLVAGGWTQEQAVAAYPMLGASPAPTAPPAPPATPAPPSGDDARAAALAGLSPEDRALLGI